MMEWIHPDMAWIGAYLPTHLGGCWLFNNTEDGTPSAYAQTIAHPGEEGIALFAQDPADLLRFAEDLRAAARALLQDALARGSVK